MVLGGGRWLIPGLQKLVSPHAGAVGDARGPALQEGSVCGEKRQKGKNHSLWVSEGGRGLAFLKALRLPQVCSCLQGDLWNGVRNGLSHLYNNNKIST